MFIATTAATLATLSCEGKATLGDMYLRMGKFQRAAEAYRERLKTNPRDLGTLRHLAQVECYKLGELTPCARHADSLLNARPVDTAGVAVGTYAHTLLARDAAARDDTATARQHLERVAEIHRYSGYWNYRSEDYHLAARNFQQLIRLQPDSTYGYLRLGLVMWNRNLDDSSLVWFRRAEEVDPYSEDALINQVVVLRGLHRIEDALAVVDRLEEIRAELYPDSVFHRPPDTVRFPPMSLDFRDDTTRWSVQEQHEYGTGF